MNANFAALSICALGIALSSVPKIELSHCFWPMILASLVVTAVALFSGLQYVVSAIEKLQYKLSGMAKELSFAAAKLSYIEARADSGNPRPQDLLRHLVQNFQTFDPQQGWLAEIPLSIICPPRGGCRPPGPPANAGGCRPPHFPREVRGAAAYRVRGRSAGAAASPGNKLKL